MNQTVSIIIPCYNHGRFLGDCIESALGQTYQPIEIIVVNDGSTDETEEICLSYGGRIQYLRQSHQGIVQTINAGIERSHGAFFYFLSADDRLSPGTLEKQMSVMEKEEDCAVVCGNAKLINEQGEETGESILPLPEKDLLFRMLISPNLHDGSLLFRRSALEAIGEITFKPFENYHGYHHRCFQLARRYRIRYLNEYLVCQRVHHNNLSHPKNIEAMIEGYGILRKKMREIIDPCEILEGADPKDPKDRAHAHFLIASLFFHFGQYEIAYQDLKRAIELEPKIWERKEVLDDPRLNVCLSPIMPVETICKDQDLTARIEVQKRTEVKEILSRIKEGEILKSFFLCRKDLEEAPEDPGCLLLLALVYLSQRPGHDSLNRFHKVTKELLEKIRARYPFHSIDLYICLAFVKPEEEGIVLTELHERSHLLKWFDLNLCLWLTKMAIALGRTKLTEQLQSIFRKKGLNLNISQKMDQGCTRGTKMKREGKKKILLVNPPYRRFLGLEAPCFPLSFGTMATLLEEQGYEAGIYDADFDRRFAGRTGTYEYGLLNHKKIGETLEDRRHPVWAEIEQTIRSFEPDIIGISAMTNKYPMVERIAEITKSVKEGIRVVIGGHHPSIYGERLIRNRNIDFAVRGEGEMTMVELVHRFSASGKDLSEVKGLIYKESGEIRTNPPRELIQNLDLLPIPNRNLILNDHYASGNNVMTGRGCPFHCSYCGARVIWKNRVRRRSVEKVLEEIRGLIQKTGSRSISFWDDSFTCDRNYLRELMKGLRRIDGLIFSCITRLDLVDKEVLHLLKQAGCHQILFGIESGSDRILKSIQKGMNRDFIKKKVEEVNSFSIPWLGFFIMGYPGETGEEMVETLRFMKELDPPYAEINIFNPLPGTPVWDALEKEGRVSSEMDFSRHSQASLENHFVSGMDQETFRKLALRMAKAFDEHNRRKQDERKCVSGKKETGTSISRIQKDEKISSILPASAPGFTKAFPVQVHFLMIDKCNAKCIFCGGDYFRSESKRLITLEKFQRMAAHLKLERFQKIVLAGAGDPLLNPNLIPIIQYTNDRYSGVGISITTNGIALTEEISEAFLRCKISDLNISINAASRNVYKRVMQVDCFDKVCRNARRFAALRREKGTGPVLQFSSAINRLNIEDLPALVELGREIGIDALNIFYTRFYPERIRHLNVDREEDRLNNQDSLFYHKELSDQMVEKAKSLAEKYGIHFFHEPLFKEYAGPRPCVWPETQLMVGFDGEIYPCGGAEVHFKEKVEEGVYPFGNALTHPIEEFWNGEMYRALRISSQAGKDCPIAECKVCANRMNPGDEKAHIMHWDTPSESIFKKEGERIDKIRKEEPEGELPLVSVIVPTYNRPDMLVETLRSILNQTYSNYEIIIVNDAGVGVENVVTFLNQAGRMTYVRHGRNLGLAAARNTGIKMAKGKYIAYLDDDDLYYPDHLETLVQFLEGNDYKVAYTDAYRAYQKKVNGRYAVVKQDVPYSFDFDDDRILLENFVPVLCFMHEKSCLDEVGCFDEDLTTQEDWDLWIRLSRKFKFAHIRKVTCEFSWREDGTTMTGGKKIDFLRNMKRIYEKYREYSKGKPNLHQVQETFFKNFDEMVKREYDRIQQLIKESLIEEAISALEKLLILFPAHSLAHDDLGVLYFHRGDNERALEHFIQSLKADPKNQNAMKNMADLRMELGQMKEALQLYQMVLADQPMDVEALLGVGNYCLRAGRLGDASYFFKQVLEIEPENMAAKEYLVALANPEEEGGSPELRVNEESQPSTALPPKEEKEKIENPKVSIIIPVFNNLCLNRQCLKSIYQNTQDSNYEIIVVDNASTDGTTDFLLHEAAKGLLRVIRNDANLGFAKACNQGAEAALSSYLMFLNNDTEPQKGWLEPLLEILENDPSVAAAGSKLLFPDGKIQHAGVVIIDDRKLPDPLVARHVYYEKPGDFNDANQRRTFQALTAACLLVRKSAFRQAGGFEEEFWNGYEDVDLCFKFQERSWKLVYQPESVVIHHESKSGPERYRRTDENTRLLHRRWLGKIDHDFILEKDGSFTHSNFGFIRPYSLPNRGDEGVLQESESINIPLVSIVILVHNQLEYTKKCIESLFKYTREPFELILVDNGSTDGTLQYLDGIRKGRDDIDGWRLKVDKDGKVEGWGGDLKGKGKIKKKKKKKERKLEENKLFCKTIKVIPNERNLGFAAGNNQGMAEAKGDYLLLMNNDVVVTPGWLERMIAVAEREPKIGIVGPKSNYVSGPQWVEKVSYDTATLAGLNSFAQSFTRRCAGQAKPFWRVVGFCMLIKRAVVEKIGGLDSRYGFGNFEDDDFSLRARLAGFESWIAEDCFVHHFGNRTFAGSGIDYSESLKRNWEIFKKKWGIPAELAYGADYDVSHLLEQNFIPVKHYCPLNPKEHNVSMGEELFAMGDLEGAKSIFEKILSENPNHKEALNNLGVIAFQQGEIAPATSFFKKVLALDPHCLEAIENMGNTMLVHHAYQEAILWFEKALEAEPNNVNLLNSLANCLIQIEEFEGAKEVYNRSYQLDCGQSHVEEILSGLEKLKTFEAQRSVTH